MTLMTILVTGMWSDLWSLDVSALEKAVRPILVYLFLLIALRLGGKRELGQMTGFDLVVLLMLSNAVQNAIIGDDNSVLGGFIGAATLLVMNYIVVRLAYYFPRIEEIVEGKPRLLIRDRQVIEKNLAKELINKSDLHAVLRRQGFDSVEQVGKAILETNGSLTVERAVNAPDEIEEMILQRLERIESRLSARSGSHGNHS